MEQLVHYLECGHKLDEPKGNSASPRQVAFCDGCKGHMSVVRTESYITPNEIRELDDAEMELWRGVEQTILAPVYLGEPKLALIPLPIELSTINIDDDATPEIHTALEDDDEPL